ncbi:TPA: thioredoxin family protein [Neisseria subflava]
MAIYAEYLDFDTEEDKLKQQQLYQATELSAQTVVAVKKISRPQNWLLAAAPYCPDCRVFVPFIQKMAELNPISASTILPATILTTAAVLRIRANRKSSAPIKKSLRCF